jgi:hypothetical protein
MAKNITALKSENTSVATVTEPNLPVGGFDYTQLDSATADVLRQAAHQIRSFERNAAQAMITIGKTLLGIRDQLDHGQFGAWLKAEFNWTARTAQNYMRAAEIFGTKCETISHLPATLIYRLAAPSTPKQIQDKVVADLEAGKSIDHRALKKEITVSRQKADSSDELRRAEKAYQKAKLILAKLPPGEQCQLLRLLESHWVRRFLIEDMRKSARAPGEQLKRQDSQFEAAGTYSSSIHEMAGPGRRRSVSIHEVPGSEVVE